MQLKVSSDRKPHNEDVNDKNQTAQFAAKEKDDNLEYLDEAGDMESYMDEVSRCLDTELVVSDHGINASSARNPQAHPANGGQHSPLPEVWNC